MRKFNRSVIKTAVLCGLFAIPSFPALARNGPGDSMSGVWSVTVKPDDAAVQSGKQEFDDMLLFDGAQMSAAACASYGFAPADFAMSENGSGFSTTMQTDDESMQWNCNVSGSSFSGLVVWTKADGSVFHYTVSGSRQGAQEQQQQQQGGE